MELDELTALMAASLFKEPVILGSATREQLETCILIQCETAV